MLQISSDPTSGAFGGPYSPALSDTAGEPQTTAGFEGQVIRFTFQAVDPVADNSRVEVDFGRADGTDRNNFMAIESVAGAGIRIAVSEPLTDGNWDTGNGTFNNFTAFTGNRELISGVDASQSHQIELRLTYVDGPNNDVVQVYLDGEYIGTTTTFENYRDFHDPATMGNTHEVNAEANQTNRLFFRNSASGAPQDGPGGQNEGFYFDDITYGVYNNANGTGNDLDNVITGNSGDNTLDGRAGADTMSGGLGNDTYVVDNAGDTVTENVGEGTDIVRVSVSGYTLSANVEIGAVNTATGLTLTGNNQGAILFGNNGDDVLIGGGGNDAFAAGAGNDTIDGGLGIDAMSGGSGNDTYFVDNLGDAVYENANEGTDTVQSSITYTLGANVENLTLTGSGNINGTGNSGNNILTGNSGANTLDGGAGADTMIGGLGNDTYVVDSLGDAVVENVGEGTDKVIATVNNVTLAANVEIGAVGLATGLTLTGNAGDNILFGGSGNDVLNGGAGNDAFAAGAGNDIINGGVGNDAMSG
ncbi:MAG: calcium-binding protein, partial [Rhodoplanes sp.]